jgi:FHA domain
VLVRRVAALLAADLDGLFPDCAACGPIADGRLAVLVWGTATARVVGGDGEVTLTATDAITSVNRLVAGPITSIRLELPGAGPASHFARLDSGVVSAAGFVAGEEAPGGAGAVFPVPVPGPAQSATLAEPAIQAQPVPARPDPGPAPVATNPVWTPPPPAVPEPALSEPVFPDPRPAYDDAAPAYADPAPAFPGAPPFPGAVTFPDAEPAWTPPPTPAWSAASPVDPLPPVAPFAEPEVPSWATPSVTDASIVPAAVPAPPAPAEASWPATPDGLTLPVRPPLADPEGSDPRPTVLGLACPLGHLNDPSLAICVACGSPLPTQPPTLREGPRPALGVMTLDDGSQHLLDTGYVLGREPQHDPEVVAGGARPLKIVDADGVVSRRHLRLALVGWDIQVIDLGSANGTYVQYPDDPQLHRLEPHHAVVVKVGTQVTMGRRSFRVDPVPPDQRG